MSWRKIIAVMLFVPILVSGVAGCAGTVTVTDQFPVPVVDPLPYRVGYLLDEEFSSYVHANEDDKVSFELGPQQSQLYRDTFEAIFTEAVPLDQLAAPGLDLVLEPKLIEYAYLTPDDNGTKFFSASMKYQVRIYSADGKLLGYWPFVAFGKSRTKFMNRNEALGEATSLALRDAAAALVTRFRQAIEKEQWREGDPEEQT